MPGVPRAAGHSFASISVQTIAGIIPVQGKVSLCERPPEAEERLTQPANSRFFTKRGFALNNSEAISGKSRASTQM